MQASLETLSTLERRLKVAVPVNQINNEVENRLKRLQRTVKLHGFRPGKVPMKVVVQQFGSQVRQEVLGDTVERTFGEAVREKNLRVAGYPRIEAQPGGEAAADFEFTATFEIFPEVKIGDLAATTIERPVVTVDEPEVDKTIEVLRKQRVSYAEVDRAAAAGDVVVIDYKGTIDGVPFDGGTAEGQSVVLGEGRLLADFETALIGMSAGATKSFELTFPADYHGTEVAGKKAVFEVTLHKVQEQKLPAVDAEFAKSLGVEDGDLAKMRADVRSNLEREVKRRVQARVKDQALKSLLESATLEIPKALVDMEIERLMAQMADNLRGRGMKEDAMNMPREAFEPEARRRVSIGLVLNELVKQNDIKAQPDQVKAMIEDYAESYEHPEEVVRWYYQSGDRVREVEAVVLENNVVDWVLKHAKVVDQPTAFDQLMGNAQ
ncbi:MAG: trigger factor [Burkholderiales bacterium]|nr:trigger factor [Burkholderiales bacterium]